MTRSFSLDMIDDLKKTSVKFGERYPLDELVHGKVFHSVSHEACLPSDSTCQEYAFDVFKNNQITTFQLNPVGVYIGIRQLTKICKMSIPMSLFYV